ncbi:MAG: UDP-N-acetylmuramoyl-L-alanine--D-glutamate ligase [Oscillospiraceae bacterium]|nr:UDP-N-acetylmuramoyl-L-alanine--D-glutamate ligase [Oscillospiraceae bacterium]
MSKLEEFKQNIKGRIITVIGIGISNLPLIKYLAGLEAGEIHACDRRTREKLGDIAAELEALGVTLHLGEDYLSFLTGDIIFRTPGLRYDVPELNAARERGAWVTSEMEVFCDICPAHKIAVTGSDGKTTTTTLIYKMLTEAGYKTWLGGNIGNPLLADTEKMSADDMVILELSSFQLHTMQTSPEIAVVTNLSPNHLDYHKDYQEYIDAKKNIFLHQGTDGVVVLNKDNADSVPLIDEAKGKVRLFSRKSKADVYLDGDVIKRGDTEVLNINDIKIPGMHNVENYMTAIAAVEGLVPDDIIVKIAKEFGGVEHRIELVRTLDGVRYYNSSIDSSPNRTINTLRVFPEKVIMISGGKDKGIPYDEVGPAIAEYVKTLILIGATSDKIQEALDKEVKKTGKGKDVEVIRALTYEDAVNTARAKASSGDVVLLSPASTSFDMLNNFMERGNLFKELVNNLQEKQQ